MRALLGPAKVWSADDPGIYDKMYERFAESLGVTHPIVCTLVWDLVHETCEISALRRARAAVPERAYQAKIERDVDLLTVLLGEKQTKPAGLFDLLLAKQEEPQPGRCQNKRRQRLLVQQRRQQPRLQRGKQQLLPRETRRRQRSGNKSRRSRKSGRPNWTGTAHSKSASISMNGSPG